MTDPENTAEPEATDPPRASMDDLDTGGWEPEVLDPAGLCTICGADRSNSVEHDTWCQCHDSWKLITDPAFAALIPPLRPDERALLEASIVADGCRDPLVTWHTPGGRLVVDGYNRLEICTRRGIRFPTVVRPFASREAVEDWMDANQLGRRNLSADQRALLLGRRYNRAKRSAPNPQGRNQHREVDPHFEDQPQGAQDADPRTSAALAEASGVSRATVERAGAFAEAVEKVGLTDLVRSGELRATQSAVIEAARKLPAGASREEVLAAVARRSSKEMIAEAKEIRARATGALPDGDRAPFDAYYTSLRHALGICRWLSTRIPAPRRIIELSVGAGNWVLAARIVWPEAVIDRQDMNPAAEGLRIDLREGERAFVGAWPETGAGLDGEHWDLSLGNPPYGDGLWAWVQASFRVADVVAYFLRETFTGSADRLAWWTSGGRPAWIAKTLPRPKWEGPGARDHGDSCDAVEIVWTPGGPVGEDETRWSWIDVSRLSAADEELLNGHAP